MIKILDTDHCIAILRGKLDIRHKVVPTDELAITAITLGELVHGVHKSANPNLNQTRLNILLLNLTILPYNDQAANYFGKIKADLEKVGMRLSDLDLQIAAVALMHGVLLLTHNLRHFNRIPHLQLDDWLV